MSARNSGHSLRRAIRRAGIAGICAIGLAPIGAEGFPLRYEMTVDTLTAGTAVLLGDLDGATWAPLLPGAVEDSLGLRAKLAGGSATQHWQSDIYLRRYRDFQAPAVVINYKVDRIESRHISNPPPHPGEASPGPPLDLDVSNLFSDLLDITGGGGPTLTPKPELSRQHEDHSDRVVAELIDLHGGPGGRVLAGISHEIRLNVDFSHLGETSSPPPDTTQPPDTTTPGDGTKGVAEPITAVLLAASLVGLVACRRRPGRADSPSARERRI